MNEVYVLIEVRGGIVISVSGAENVRVAILDHDNFDNDPSYYANEEGIVGWYQVDEIMNKEEIIKYVEQETKNYLNESNRI